MPELNISSEMLLYPEAGETKKLIECLEKRKIGFHGETKVVKGKRAIHLICNADAAIEEHLLFWDTVWECQKYCSLIYDLPIHKYWKTLSEKQRIMFFNKTKVTAKLLTSEPSTLILSSFCRKSLDRAQEFLSRQAQKQLNCTIIPVQIVNTNPEYKEIPRVVFNKATDKKQKTNCSEPTLPENPVPVTGKFEPSTRQLLLKLATDQELVILRIMQLEQELARLKENCGKSKLLETIETKREEFYEEMTKKFKNQNHKTEIKEVADILSRLERIEMILMEIRNRSTPKMTESRSQQTDQISDRETKQNPREDILLSSMKNSSGVDIDSIIARLNKEVNELKDRLPTFDGIPEKKNEGAESTGSQSTASLLNSQTIYSTTLPPEIHSINIEFPMNQICKVQKCVEYWTGGTVSAEANFFIEPSNEFCTLRIDSVESGEIFLIAREVWEILIQSMNNSITLKRPDIAKMFASWSTTEKLLFEIKAQTAITFGEDMKSLILRGWDSKTVELVVIMVKYMLPEDSKLSQCVL